MASLHFPAGFSFTCSYSREQKLRIKVGAFSRISTAKVSGKIPRTAICKYRRMVSAESLAELGSITKTRTRQNIPTKKQLIDSFRRGIIVEGGVGYRQTVVIRSCEIGADKTATLESLLNLLQETALNHVWISGLLGDGFGATHGMIRNNLIWVVTRMQLQVDQYPTWGEVVEVDTWVGASGKNGMRRDWLIRSHVTGLVYVRATSTWVMMNQKTRRLSKMPEEVRAEISPWFIEKNAIQENTPETIKKLDNTVKYINSKLKPKRTDLDMNNHVNNVKYVNWMLEAIPEIFLEGYQLFSMTLEYRRECGSSDTVQSLCQPDEDGAFQDEVQDDNGKTHKEQSQVSELEGDASSSGSPLSFTHLLQMTGDSKTDEIVRGRTTWKRKPWLFH
ncbi:PREDICTED: palmitoyl-acyl carrier protein thioesterase, chloroplastic [Theobroma cacao]|uniref:Acyl-[acyl-carrier-protein] hydrolase n=1 Tax=Theobroma cacao TaxID=3641 RepID=A0AB32W0X8_THECC|nr:PREDICTED: palmitoyl-acyl carrier protein thioesterase, chloroplastic [Theobroma cacao]